MGSNPTKRQLRRRYRRRLASIDAATARSASEAMAEHVVELSSVQQAQGVLSCLSFGVEIDTWRLVERLKENGKRLYVPRVERGGTDLFIHPFPCELEITSYGLSQPIPSTPQLDVTDVQGSIDVVLVLGLAFDREGYRLGYGGGYFDRFLARYRFPAVGLGYANQIVETLPREDHDIPMSEIVTDKGTCLDRS